MKLMKNKGFTALALALAAMLVLPIDAYARGSSSSGGSRSSFSGSRSSSGSSGRSSGSSWGSSSPKSSGSSSSSGWGSSGSRFSSGSSSPKLSDADRALATKAKSSGTLFSSRDDAVKDFGNKYSPQYTNKFVSEPSQRPSYIPNSTTVNGQPVNIIYNSGFGGYGYWLAGSWIMYDVMRDAAMADTLMRRHNYAYGPDYYAAGHGGSYYGGSVAHSGGWSCFGTFFGLLVLLVIIAMIVWIIRSASRRGPTVVRERVSPPPRADWREAAPPSPKDTPGDTLRDNSSGQYWQAIKVGAIITLRDELALKDSLERTGKADGISYTVTDIRRIDEARGVANWTMLHLQGNYREFQDQKLWLVAKTVDRNFDLLAFEELHDVPPGNRRDFVERDDRWLFQEPGDPSRIEWNKLRYTTDITRTVQGEGGPVEITFVQKPQGELFGACVQEPRPSGQAKPQLAGIVEYITDQPCDNPQILVLELGDENSPEGGSITLMEGGPMNPADVAVL